MDVLDGVKIIAGVTAGLVILLVFMIQMIYKRRNRITTTGLLTGGLVIDIVERSDTLCKSIYYRLIKNQCKIINALCVPG